MTKSELIKAYRDFYAKETGASRALTELNKDFDVLKKFVEFLTASATEVSVPGFFNLKYRTREAGVSTIAGKEYNLGARTTPIVKLAKSFNIEG